LQDNSDIEWKYARAWIIRDILEAPLVPIPINVIHVVAKLVSRFCYFSEESDGPPAQQRTLFVQRKTQSTDTESNEQMKKRYKAKLPKTEVN
jgi:hypothetical protein